MDIGSGCLNILEWLILDDKRRKEQPFHETDAHAIFAQRDRPILHDKHGKENKFGNTGI